ncbi:MAG TPA: hypothetical protein VFT45_12475 [Longimicrobium sp.]|nr:hypothetical protein [Longimicrobium sp.]
MRIKLLAALGLCLLSTACVRKWDPQYGPVPQTAADNQGRTVRLMMKNGGPVELRNMRVEGDSIVGDAGYPPQRYAVAAEDVQVLTVSRVDRESPVTEAISTVGAVALALILGAVLLGVQLINKLP